MVIDILLLFIFLILSGVFSGSEVALISLSDIDIQSMTKKKLKGSRAIRKLKSDSQKMIITILIGNNIVNIAASVLATIIATDVFGSAGAGIAIGVMTFLVLIFGEISPKSYATNHPKKVSRLVAPFILFLQKLLFPIVIMFQWMSNFALKFFGSESPINRNMTEEKIRIAIDLGEAHDEIEENESKLMKNILKFNDITAGEVMTQRQKMFCLDANMKIKDALRVLVDCPYSRIPLFLGSLDNIIGIIHIKEVLTAVSEGDNNATLREYSVKPTFINERMIIDDLFKNFQERHTHIAIVVGEKGNTVGLVTTEDLIEEIVGEIIDESDVTPNKIMRIDKNSILVDGETSPKYVNSFFQTRLPEDFETIDEFLQAKHKDKLKRGMEIKIGRFVFYIEETGEEHVERVLIRKK